MSTPKIEPSTKNAFNFPKAAVGKDKTATAPASKAAKKPTPKRAAAKRPAAKEAATGKPAAEKPAAKKPSKKGIAEAPTSAKKLKQEAKATAKRIAQPTSKTATETTGGLTVTGSNAKTKRGKKDKVARDSFTMPKSEYAKIASLKQKCASNGLRVKKAELLRAALAMLDAATEKQIVAAVKALEAVKTGRPANA
ncbi:hypothetical protein AWB81_06990 [Caballeronia arationis]|uniref:hypothetical protein n=1 Tax=Caballeronia arationis TaxID=1777142 RepID=UPI00074C125A|nr:hypothetical protein [Caballeronia arationis]SAL05031.1 hypothetical protein AWB81_06990 [Caballeronia arationis]